MNCSIRMVSALAFVSCIISCKKDKDKIANSSGPRLSKMITWSATTPTKKITTTDFIYDDQKRVAEIAISTGDSVGSEIKSVPLRNLKFLYKGNDKNPYKVLANAPAFSNSATEIFYTYNTSGYLVIDSATTAPFTSSFVNKYAYSTDKLIVKREHNDNNYKSTSTDSFRVVNNNLTEAYITLNPYSSPSGYKLSYDTKINPLSELNISSVAVVSSMFDFPSYLAPGFCKNNITQYSYGYSPSPGQFTVHSTVYNRYAYNVNNLPDECRTTDGSTANSLYTITKYYYNN